MKTQIKRQGDTLIVSMDGKLDFETYIPLRENLSSLNSMIRKSDSIPTNIIFNLEGLEFVGSSGISGFIRTLKDFGVQAPVRPRFCNVKSEFRRIMQALDDTAIFEFYDSEDRAKTGNSGSHLDH